MILALAATASVQDRDPEAVRRQLHDILRRPEFRQKLPSGFWARLRELLRIKSSEPSAPPEIPSSPCQISSPGVPGSAMTVLYILAIAILAAFLIAIGYHAWARRGLSRAPPPARAAPSPSAMPDPLARDAREWTIEADGLFRQGRVAEAIRALYLAVLSFSHVRRWIDYHPSKANWEHVRRFSGPGPAKASLGSLTSMFEQKWYGRKPAAESEYRRSRELAAGILEFREGPA
jgi:hypothetical protein